MKYKSNTPIQVLIALNNYQNIKIYRTSGRDTFGSHTSRQMSVYKIQTKYYCNSCCELVFEETYCHIALVSAMWISGCQLCILWNFNILIF